MPHSYVENLTYSDPEERFFFFNRVLSVISVVQRKTTLSISDSSGVVDW